MSKNSASRSAHRQFHGHITEIAREGANGGLARYRLIIEPWLAFHGHTQDSSWDYRSLSTRPQGAASTIDNGQLPRTVAWHDPGQYAWQNTAHGERMLLNQRQAIDARMKQYTGEGTVRSAAPGTTFTLADHPEHDLDSLEQRKFLITAVTHEARGNLAEVVNGEASQEQGGERQVDL